MLGNARNAMLDNVERLCEINLDVANKGLNYKN